MLRRYAGLALAAVLAALPAVGGCFQSPRGRDVAILVASDAVTPVEGPSLLTRLGLSVEDTPFGRNGGLEPAPPTARVEPRLDVSSFPGSGGGMFSRMFGGASTDAELAARNFVLSGADLYRIDCQSCHGPTGAGAPPVINALVGPVQGTSVAFLTAEMRKRSRPVDQSFLRTLAQGAVGDFRARMRNGGKKMPAFAHLDGREVDALLGYLRRMVAVPDAPAKDTLLKMPAARVGEHLVKGTCHTCHDATGPGRGGMMMMTGGGIPSLASMPTEESLDDLIAKVRDGVAPPMMMMRQGPSRMPRLPYLTPQELAAAIVYLRQYPPQS